MEDEPVVRAPLRAMLASEGYAVVAVESAEAAETVLDHEPVDVVLSDFGLPDTDGAALAARHPGIPFVLMTGLPPDQFPRAALPPSVTACLVKPLDVPNLLAVLREAVTARRVMREANRALSGVEHSTSAPTEED